VVAAHLVAHPQMHHLLAVVLRAAQAVDADTEATITTSRRLNSEAVAASRSRSISSLMLESFSM
jgi:hypothetical protein